LYAFQTLREQLKLVFPKEQYQLVGTKRKHYGFNYGIDIIVRLNLLKTGRICSLSIQKLLCIENQPPIRNQLRLGKAISSRHHYRIKMTEKMLGHKFRKLSKLKKFHFFNFNNF
jgi:hypothetical protein